MITWKCPNCWTKYEVDEKFEAALAGKKDCKFCVRKDPNVPTTAEMDGWKTIEEMRERDQVVIQCFDCMRWTQQTYGAKFGPCTGKIRGQPYLDGRGKVVPGCGAKNYDSTSMKSLRTHNRDIDNKRKAEVKKKR